LIDTATDTAAWTSADAEALYRLPAWADGFFHVGDDGRVYARPDPDGPEIDVYALASRLRADGAQTPLLLRFQDILRARVVGLNEAFRSAIAEAGYDGRYTSVYPIKVNQLHEVVEEILEAGEPYGIGLECGSKAELVATLAHLKKDDTLLVCNGYKDAPMLRAVLLGQRLGKRVVPVMEKLDEFWRLMRLAEQEKVDARFGVRIQLATRGAGKWAASSGDGSKFGVGAPDLMQIVRHLEETDQQDALVLLHFHLGSQIADIQTLKQAAKEAAQVYVQLKKRGLGIRTLDVGGGLGVSYGAGYATTTEEDEGDSGVSYSLQEYANAVVWAVKDVCDAAGVEVPELVSESGRALTAHHSVLVVEALSSYGPPSGAGRVAVADDAPPVLKDLADALARVDAAGPPATQSDAARLLEAYHDAVEKRADASTLFGLGYLDLETKADAEALYWGVLRGVDRAVREADPELRLPQELRNVSGHLQTQVLCDFSVFQSVLDHWAIGQRFPILPLHRLDEKPTERGVLVDLTCDSDGKITSYVGQDEEDKRAIEHHALRPGEPYLFGFFLMGAYQDIMGDTHNLLGRVTEAHVYADADEPGGCYVEKQIPGATVDEMLANVQYFPHDLLRRVEGIVRQKVHEKALRPKAGAELVRRYERLFKHQTYLVPDGWSE
jgi:arginine decarboxylase